MKISDYIWTRVPMRFSGECGCDTMLNHWRVNSYKGWPCLCSVEGCEFIADNAISVASSDVVGVSIIVVCAKCTNIKEPFNIKDGVKYIAEVNYRLCG